MQHAAACVLATARPPPPPENKKPRELVRESASWPRLACGWPFLPSLFGAVLPSVPTPARVCRSERLPVGCCHMFLTIHVSCAPSWHPRKKGGMPTSPSPFDLLSDAPQSPTLSKVLGRPPPCFWTWDRRNNQGKSPPHASSFGSCNGWAAEAVSTWAAAPSLRGSENWLRAELRKPQLHTPRRR